MTVMAATEQGPIRQFLAWVTAGDPLDILITIAVAVLLTIVFRRIIRRVVNRTVARSEARHLIEQQDMAADPKARATRMAQRAQAIGTLLTSVVSLLIWINALLVILELIGINITPLLASAGVVGVALAFGAQTLVKDYLAGIFLIIEDQYGVGDVVQFDAVTGVIEEVALRTTRVRDFTGVVWYLRNGEILNVANRSQGWSLAIVELPVATATDFTVVRRVVDEVGQALVRDPEFGAKVIAAPVFMGIEVVAGDALLVRVTERVVPEHQLLVQRALRERLITALQSAGVVIPQNVVLADLMLARPTG
ncbi:MAG: mechanosensitive ion channel family protein [Actinobacteria bacterium]|nr:mechanosensitive ion channel family protein [Actinomycetota bacterium]